MKKNLILSLVALAVLVGTAYTTITAAESSGSGSTITERTAHYIANLAALQKEQKQIKQSKAKEAEKYGIYTETTEEGVVRHERTTMQTIADLLRTADEDFADQLSSLNLRFEDLLHRESKDVAWFEDLLRLYIAMNEIMENVNAFQEELLRQGLSGRSVLAAMEHPLDNVRKNINRTRRALDDLSDELTGGLLERLMNSLTPDDDENTIAQLMKDYPWRVAFFSERFRTIIGQLANLKFTPNSIDSSVARDIGSTARIVNFEVRSSPIAPTEVVKRLQNHLKHLQQPAARKAFAEKVAQERAAEEKRQKIAEEKEEKEHREIAAEVARLRADFAHFTTQFDHAWPERRAALLRDPKIDNVRDTMRWLEGGTAAYKFIHDRSLVLKKSIVVYFKPDELEEVAKFQESVAAFKREKLEPAMQMIEKIKSEEEQKLEKSKIERERQEQELARRERLKADRGRVEARVKSNLESLKARLNDMWETHVEKTKQNWLTRPDEQYLKSDLERRLNAFRISREELLVREGGELTSLVDGYPDLTREISGQLKKFDQELQERMRECEQLLADAPRLIKEQQMHEVEELKQRTAKGAASLARNIERTRQAALAAGDRFVEDLRVRLRALMENASIFTLHALRPEAEEDGAIRELKTVLDRVAVQNNTDPKHLSELFEHFRSQVHWTVSRANEFRKERLAKLAAARKALFDVGAHFVEANFSRILGNPRMLDDIRFRLSKAITDSDAWVHSTIGLNINDVHEAIDRALSTLAARLDNAHKPDWAKRVRSETTKK